MKVYRPTKRDLKTFGPGLDPKYYESDLNVCPMKSVDDLVKNDKGLKQIGRKSRS